MITLSDEQNLAIKLIKDFIEKSDNIAFSLTGAAGTGKTLIMNTLVNDLEEHYTVTLCAPTHKAKLVLERATNRGCNTIHSLLALTPNLDIFELDLNDLLFKSNDEKIAIPTHGVVICDEASMINDDLYKALLQKCSVRHTKIVFVSDEKQLRPVKEEHESLVYTVEDQFRLTKIFRQSEDNALLPILETLRHKSIDNFKTNSAEEGSLIVENDVKIFLKNYLSNLKTAINNSDILETKLTAYTNNRVNSYNKLIKKVLFPNNQEYNKTEFLTCCDNFIYDGSQFWNSMDYIIESEPSFVEKELPYFDTMKGWVFDLYDSILGIPLEIFILSKENSTEDFNRLAYKIEDFRISALQAKGRRKAAFWGMYYALKDSFASPIDLYLDGRLIKKKTFTEGYACTTHKLQGSSFENIFIDMKDINNCRDEKIKQQLQYVAISRTRHNAYLLQ